MQYAGWHPQMHACVTMNFFIIIALSVSVAESYKILALLPYPGKSHHMVFEPLLQELTTRGHDLTVVSFFPAENRQSNRRDVNLSGLAPLNVEVINLQDFDSLFDIGGLFQRLRTVAYLARSNVELCKKILSSKVFEEFVKGKGQYDVIIVEHFNSDCMLGVIHKYGLPSVGLLSCVMMPWTPLRVGAAANPAYFPNMMLPFTENMSIWERIYNAFYIDLVNMWFDYTIRVEEQKVVEEALGYKLPPLTEVAKNTSVVLVNAHHSWNGVKVIPPSIVEVGGIHLHNKTVQRLPESLKKWVDESDGFVVFSFGSLIRGSTLPENRLKSILTTFARFNQRFVWKWEDDKISLPDNVITMKWLPQYDLLRHHKCVGFITHGGMLSMTEAVAAGVPVLAVPVMGDQPGNAAHAQRAGFAEILHLEDIDEDTMYNAMQKVLSAEMRAKAKAVSNIWWDRPVSPMVAAVFYIEKTAKYNGLNLSSHSRWISATQLIIFEVLGVAFFATIVLTIAGCCICRFTKTNQDKIKQN